MIGNLIGCLFVLFILFGLLCNLTGDENKGTQIIILLLQLLYMQ